MDDYEGEQETLDVQKSAGDNSCENDEGDKGDDAGDEVKLGFQNLKMWSRMPQKELQKEQTENTEGLRIILAGQSLTATYY